jgi:membrane-associated phospholipid phosphatase/UDP-2,3-diacylglucosamine pyrophosphatase LpxH
MLWPTEKLFIGYAIIMACLLALAALQDPLPALLLMFVHAAAIGLMVLLAKWPAPFAQFVRHWYLLAYVPFCYKQVPYLVTALNLRPADAMLARWDQAMWKVDPVFWLSSMQNTFLAEFLQLVYTMFIPGTLVLGIILWWRRSRPEFRYGTFLIAMTFLISYLGYLGLPARGPRFMAYASQYPALQGLWTFHSLQNLLDTLEGVQYDCFPSGHVAVVLVGCYVARKISARVFYGFSAFAALIAISTVYLRYHYVIDVITGILLAVFVIAASPAIYRKLGDDYNPLVPPMPEPVSTHLDSRGTSPADALRREDEKLQRLSANPPEEIFVVSDFHLGQGRNPETGRFWRTENFLSDQAFLRFLDYARPGPRKLLYINGDTFDFVRVCGWPKERAELEEWSRFLDQLGVRKAPDELAAAISKKELRFGLETDDYKSVWKLLQIGKGHGEFFQALAGWVNRGGLLLFAKGNHDLELYWPLVREALGQLLRQHGADAEAMAAQVYYCDNSLSIGNVYFEHGHRYDPQQRIDDSDKSPVLADKPGQLKLPLGIFVNRYLINQLEKLEPFLGSVRPTERILWMLLRKHPVAAVTVLFRSLWFIERAFQTSRVRDFFWYAVYIGSLALPFVTALFIAGVFAFAGVRQRIAIEHRWISGVLGAMGLLAPYLAAAFRELMKWLGKKLRKKDPVGEDDLARGVYDTLQDRKFPAATRIYAVMGHTHDQDVQALPPLHGSAVLYLNTGTWIPVWPDNRPDLDGQVLFPFVHFSRIAPQEYVHQYLEWRDDRGTPAESYILEPPPG